MELVYAPVSKYSAAYTCEVEARGKAKRGERLSFHLAHLVGVHDELLAQQRAVHPGLADQLQVVEAALEELLVRAGWSLRTKQALDRDWSVTYLQGECSRRSAEGG